MARSDTEVVKLPRPSSSSTGNCSSVRLNCKKSRLEVFEQVMKVIFQIGISQLVTKEIRKNILKDALGLQLACTYHIRDG